MEKSQNKSNNNFNWKELVIVEEILSHTLCRCLLTSSDVGIKDTMQCHPHINWFPTSDASRCSTIHTSNDNAYNIIGVDDVHSSVHNTNNLSAK